VKTHFTARIHNRCMMRVFQKRLLIITVQSTDCNMEEMSAKKICNALTDCNLRVFVCCMCKRFMLVYEILGSENIYCNSKIHNFWSVTLLSQIANGQERFGNWGYWCDSKRSEVCVSSFGV
jgi:hypothetical protein